MTADPWLSARMAQYAVIRRAEAQLHPAIRNAVKAFLEEASTGPLGALTAAADDRTNPAGIPSASAWQRILGRFVLGPTRALWRQSFGRITGRPDDTPANDAGHGAGLTDRLAGFRQAFADRLMRALLLGRQRGETGPQLQARVAALMTLEAWDGHVMTMTRTETMTALNAGALHGALAEQQRTGETWEKRWQATHDQRVRDTHHEADGQIRPLHSPFDVGGHRLQFPGDPKGPPGEVINCRCAARYAPAGDVSLTASAPQEGHPMTTATAPATAPSPITVQPSGRWQGTLGFMDEWSADERMLAAPDGGVRARPLPLPLLVQEVLADGHEGSKLGIGSIDRIWTDGNAVMGEGRFDMEDPVAAKIARKVGLQFIRFVSLDVDDATSRQVVVDVDGNIVPDDQLSQMKGVSIGDVYSGWRIMGATLLAHPAFPNAAIALADENGKAMTASAFADFVGYNPDWGCVKPNGDAFEPCDCQDPDAVPANPTSDGPFQPEPDPSGHGQAPLAAVKDPTKDSPAPAPDQAPAAAGDPAQDVPEDILADDAQAAEVADPAAPAAPDAVGAPCVVQNPDGTWTPADCGNPNAVPANLTGDGPADAGGDVALAVDSSASDPVGDPATANPEPVSAPTHAGLAVVAQDTGRVLLLQRAIDPEDPASGTWEFPGGSIDPGEDPKDAALREFAEETGITLPDIVTIQDGWTSPNGVYQAFIGVLAVERDLDLNPAHATRETVNPDDPQGEDIEVAAWWDPEHLPELAALREEVRDTPWDILKAAIGSDPAAPPADNAPQMSTVPQGCTPCQAVSITAAAAGTLAAGWAPPADWFQAPTGHSGAYGIHVDEDGRVGGYLAAWGSCHIGYKGRCVPPPRSATDYSYFNVRPVKTNTDTVYCGLLTMDTGHASLSASATSALAHYDNTGTQAAVVRVGEDNHGIYAVGAVLPFLTPEQRLKLSLASFSGDWREIRGGVELIAALAVNSPGFPLAARKTGADNRPYALVAAGALPPAASLTIPADQVREVTVGAQTLAPLTVTLDTDAVTAAVASAVLKAMDDRAERHARTTAATGTLSALRTTTQARRMKDAARRMELARARITPQPQRKTETPMELVGTGALPNPSTHDIALAKNWVDQQGGLPPYIKRITKHLKDKGMDDSRAIATAVNAAKKMCASGDLNWPGIQKVNPGSKAEACAAVARWEEMKAAAHAGN